MKLERFMALCYGFVVCFAALLVGVATLVAVVSELSSLRSNSSTNQEQALRELATPRVGETISEEEFRARYPDAQPSKPATTLVSATSTGDIFDQLAQRQSSTPVAIPFKMRLDLLRRGEQLGRENAMREFQSRLSIRTFAVHIFLFLVAFGIFAFHWRWLQQRLDARRESPPTNGAA